MTFLQALAYFAREAALNLFRGWKVSLVAVLTIAVSLSLSGVFLLVGGNLRQMAERWQGESKVVVYLEPAAGAEAGARLQRQLEEAPWTLGVELISAAAAEERFRETFPSMADLLTGWGGEPLPASLEIGLDWSALERREELERWLQELASDPAVSMVDDDRDWLGKLRAVVLVIDALGMVLGAVLLVAAIFTISSVIRLTAYLYRDEIAVMRLVGATEFFIRGPFYLEGVFQGLAGGALAVAALLGVHVFLIRNGSDSLLMSFLAPRFLGPGTLLALVGLGGLAGLIGAVSSLRKEDLGETAETPEWSGE